MEWTKCGAVLVLGCFEFWGGLLESFYDYSLKEFKHKQQGDNCKFDAADPGLYLFILN